MEKSRRQQLSFSTYEAYQKIKKNDPLKLIFESIEWSFISPLVKDYYPDNKDLIYSPLSLFKAQLLLYLGEVESNRQLAEALRYNTKYCVLCGFHRFTRTPSHSTFSAFRKKIGEDLFYKVIHRLVAYSTPMVAKKIKFVSPHTLHIAVYSEDGKLLRCNCKGKCKMESIFAESNREVSRKNFAYNNYKIRLYIDKESAKPIAAELRPK